MNSKASSVLYAGYLKHRSIVWFQESFLAAPCIVKRVIRPSTQGRFIMTAAVRQPSLAPAISQAVSRRQTEWSDEHVYCQLPNQR